MKQDKSTNSADLRGAAETRLQAHAAQAFASPAQADALRLMHELQVHQIELEMQNEELRNSRCEVEVQKERYADLYDYAPSGYVTLGRSGAIIQINLTGARLLGRDRARLVDQRFESLVVMDNQASFIACLRRVFATQDNQFCEVALRANNRLPVFIRVEAVLAADGQECRAVLIDITERKRTEEALTTSEREFRLLAEAMPHIVWITRGDGHTTYFNQHWVEYTGLTLEESYGDGWNKPFHPDDRRTAWDAWQNAVNNTGTYCIQCRLRRADGVYRWWLVRGVPVREKSGKIAKWFGTCTDIDEIHRTEQELTAHRDHLQELVESRTADLVVAKTVAETANNAKSRFLAAASHDLRQPLAALSLYIDVLKIKHEPPPEKLLANMTKCVDSLSELLCDLLDISMLEAAVTKSEPTNFAVCDLLAMLVTVHTPTAQKKGLQLRCRLAGVYANTDRVLLARILGNLLANAVRYTQHGGVLIAHRRHAGKAWIEVWDSGMGIPAGMIDTIFQEYRQLNPNYIYDDGPVGSGLGLAIVAKTAALLGLEIRVQSRLGRGSMFAVELPLGKAEPTLQRGLPSHAPSIKAQRIALVDDNAAVLDALSSVLEGKGNEVVAAASGPALMQLLGGDAPDLLITDYRLSEGETGLDVIALARQAFGENLPAIIVTGDTDPKFLGSVAIQGITVQHKPLQIDTLQKLITSATKRRLG